VKHLSVDQKSLQTSFSNQQHQDYICLNVGCGNVTNPNGWENIDASLSLRISKIPAIGRSILSLTHSPQWSNLVKYGDIVRGLPGKEQKYHLIFACHVLEHLSLEDFHQAMTNIYSYLHPGGIFRIIVPDLEQYITTYLSDRADNRISSSAADEFMTKTWLGHQGSRKSLHSRILEGFSNFRHQWMWDEPSLKAAFTHHHFTNIRRCYYGDWQDTRFATVEKEDNYIKAIGIEGMK
jgi:Methyltransferase domain